MKLNRLISGNQLVTMLLVVTALLQVGILYRQVASVPSGPELVRDAVPGSVVAIGDMPTLGSKAAAVVVIEFSDYECPFCRIHATSVFGELKKRFVETGRVRYAVAHHPLSGHQNAAFLAAAAICAGAQGEYWALHDAIFQTQPRTLPDMLPLLDELAIERHEFEECVVHEDTRKRVRGDTETAKRLGLSGTPGFAIGRVDSEGRVAVEVLISGSHPFDVFERAIEGLL